MKIIFIVPFLLISACSTPVISDRAIQSEETASVTVSLPSLTPVPSRTTIPSHTPTLTPSPTPSIKVTDLADQWILYQDEDVGISFEYPAVYNHPDYNWFCQPYANVSKDSQTIYIYFTETAYIVIEQSPDRSAAEILEGLIARDENEGEIGISAMGDSIVLGYSGYYVNYFSERGFHAASFADLPNGGLVIIEWNPGVPICDVPEIGLDYDMAYKHFEETLMFLE